MVVLTSSQIADSNVDRHARRSFIPSSKVVAEPGNIAWECWVDAFKCQRVFLQN
jgi:hypothetical protein